MNVALHAHAMLPMDVWFRAASVSVVFAVKMVKLLTRMLHFVGDACGLVLQRMCS